MERLAGQCVRALDREKRRQATALQTRIYTSETNSELTRLAGS